MLRWYVGRSKLRKEEWLYNQHFAFPIEISPTFANPGSFGPYLFTNTD